jgi:ADP-ribose pyrophosphatase YjhB (NUDIX family)
MRKQKIMEKEQLLNYLKRVESMAKTGLSYGQDPYDLERYEELKVMTHEIMSSISNVSAADLKIHFDSLDHYPTPKVDVRGVVMKGDQILLVREKSDGNWALPGGWCDVGLSPGENVVKEVREESGLDVSVARLLSVWDKKHHDHPHDLNYVYKLCFLCISDTDELNPGHEVIEAAYFSVNELPQLSLMRNTKSQIIKLIELAQAGSHVDFD